MTNKLLRNSVISVLSLAILIAAVPMIESAIGTGESMLKPVNISATYVPGPITLNPTDAAWAATPEVTASLDMKATEWRLARTLGIKMFKVSDAVRRLVKVKAVNNGTDIFFRFQWKDTTNDSTTAETNRFADAMAISIPFNVPGVIHMGSYDAINGGTYNASDPLSDPTADSVNIIQWRADREPANLVAVGEFTIQKTNETGTQNIREYHKYANGVWTVIISRPMASASVRGNQINFVRGASYPIAFANWNGGIDGERNGNKMITGAYQNLTIK